MQDKNDNQYFIYTKSGKVTGSGSFIIYLLLLFVLIYIDQHVKGLVFNHSWGSFLNWPSIGLELFLFKNYNFAFSLPVPIYIMYSLYALILYFILRYLNRNFSYLNVWNRIAWILILAGALSNICERVRLGYVRDYISFLQGIFNIADIYITCGVVILLISMLLKKD